MMILDSQTQQDMLTSRSENRGSIVVLSLVGQLDALTSDEMGKVTETLKTNGVKKVVFNLEDLSLIDSSGVGTIVSVVRSTRARNGDVTVANLRNQPKEVFKILNLHKAIEVFDSVDQAVESLHQRI